METSSSLSSTWTVFINSSLETHLAMNVADADTVGDLKKKVAIEHSICFPNIGDITIHAMKVKRKSHFYHLSDSMLVKSAFDGFNGTWFLHMDAASVYSTRNQEGSKRDCSKSEECELGEKLQLLPPEMEPTNLFSCIGPSAEDGLPHPYSGTIVSDHHENPTSEEPSLKPSFHGENDVHRDSQFVGREPSEDFEPRSEDLNVQFSKFASDTRVDDLVAKTNKVGGTNIESNSYPGVEKLTVDGDETNSASFVNFKREIFKRSRDLQLDNGSSENLPHGSIPMKKPKEMINEVASAEPRETSFKENDGRDGDMLDFQSTIPDNVADLGQKRNEAASKELVKKSVPGNWSSEHNLVDKKNKKKRKSSIHQTEVVSKVLPGRNDGNYDGSESNYENGLPGHDYTNSHTLRSSGTEVAQKNPEKALEVSLRGFTEDSNLQAAQNQAHMNPSLVSKKGSHPGSTKPEMLSASFLISPPNECNDSDKNLSMAAVSENELDFVFSKNKDAVHGVENKGNASNREVKFGDKKSKKPKKHQSASEKSLVPPFIEESNKQDFTSMHEKGTLGDRNIYFSEVNENREGDTAPQGKSSGLDEDHEGQIDGQDGHGSVKVPEAHEVTEVGDVRDKKRKKVKNKKTRATDLENHGISGVDEIKKKIFNEGDVTSEHEKGALGDELFCTLKGNETGKEDNMLKGSSLDLDNQQVNEQDRHDTSKIPKGLEVTKAGDLDNTKKKKKTKKTSTTGVENYENSGVEEINQKFLNKEGVSSKYEKGTLRAEIVCAPETNEAGIEDNRTKCRSSGTDEAQMNDQDGHATLIPDAPEVTEAGDLRDKGTKRGKPKQTGATGVENRGSSGAEEGSRMVLEDATSKHEKDSDGDENICTQANEPGKEDNTPKGRSSVLDEAQMNGQGGNDTLKVPESLEVTKAGDLISDKRRKKYKANKTRTTGVENHECSGVEVVHQKLFNQEDVNSKYEKGSLDENVRSFEANKTGKEDTMSMDRSALDEAQMKDQDGHDTSKIPEAREITEGGDHNDRRRNKLLAKETRTAGVENHESSGVEEVNKGNLGDANICAVEATDSGKEDNIQKGLSSGLGEAQMNDQDGDDCLKIPEVPEVTEAGDLVDKRRKKLKTKKARTVGVKNHASSGVEEVFQKFNGEGIFKNSHHGNEDREMGNKSSQNENHEMSRAEGVDNNEANNGRESEVNTLKFVKSSQIEENLEYKDEKRKRKSKKNQETAENTNELSMNILGTNQTRKNEKLENLSSENVKKSKANLDAKLSEPVSGVNKNPDNHQTGENDNEEPRRRKKLRPQKNKPKTYISDSVLEGEKDCNVKAGASSVDSLKANTTNLNDKTQVEVHKSEPEMFVPKASPNEFVGPGTDLQAMETTEERTLKGKSNKRAKKFNVHSLDAFPVKESPHVLDNDNPSEKKASVVSGDKFEMAPPKGREASKRNASLKESKVYPTASSDNTESVQGSMYTSRVTRQSRGRSDQYRVAVRKPPNKKLGVVLTDSDPNQSLLVGSVSIFDQNGSESSHDGDEVNHSDATTPSPSDDSYISDYSEGEETPNLKKQANMDSPRTGSVSSFAFGRKNENSSNDIVPSQSQSTNIKKPLGTILRSSRSYRKAKITASKFMLEDSESQPIDFEPDSQAAVALSQP